MEGVRENEPRQEQGEHERRLQPRIYAASLADYNAGRLHGVWLDAATQADELASGIQQMLAASREPVAEEWAIHDYEGFGSLRLDEYESLERVSALGRGLVEHGAAFGHYARLLAPGEDVSDFRGAYLGRWPSLEAYVEELLTDLGAEAELEERLPAYLQPYVRLDAAAFGRDLEIGGDIMTSQDAEGVYVFAMSP